ncbi:hypothetical protein, partial [Metabacillus idriensis]|uniref:hypothetical protein n=1 Tax=Metabacillus idriensis TaxID=324768 RepID=UPI00174A3AE2
IELIFVLLIILAVLQQLSFIDLDLLNSFFSLLPIVPEDINRQLVFSQISVTFIISSLFPLIISLKKEKVLGTSIYIIAFANSLLGNIILVCIAIFSLLFINISLYVGDNSSLGVLPIFLIALCILSFLIFKIILFTNSLKISTNKVASIYYWENRKIILKKPKRARYSLQEDSEYLYNLKEDTHEKVIRKDIEYKRNFYVYERIANLSLHNHKSKVQENYTEVISSPDIITFWAEGIEELIKSELYADALTQYILMIKLFIFHETYISSYKINDLLKLIFNSISAAQSKVIFEQNKKLLLMAIKLTMQYGYYKINNDFSNTRLGKLNLEIHLCPLYDDFLVDYYTVLDKHLGLESQEKSEKIYEYFESIRVISFDLTHSHHSDFREIKYYEVFRAIVKNNGDLSLLGIPLSKLLILLMQNNKKGRILYFLNDFNNSSIYYACLIVASKLTTLYFRVDSNDKKIIADYLVLFLMKLVTWENYQFKYNCNILKRMANESSIENAYGNYQFTSIDAISLDVIKQVIMIKKNNVNFNEINFSNEKLGEIITLLSAVGNDFLEALHKEERKAIKDEFGVLLFL